MRPDADNATRKRIRELEDLLHQKEAELALLTEIAEIVASEEGLDSAFATIAERARTLLTAKTVTIPLLSADQTSYTYRAAAGLNAEELSGAELPIEVGLCGWVLRHRKPWWRGTLDDLEEHERNLWEKRAGNAILVPLIGKRRFLGGIAAIDKLDGSHFTRHDLELLALFSRQVGFVVENAIYVEELETATKRTEAYRRQLEQSNQQLVRTNEELEHLALHDPLTGLPNRSLVIDRLQQAILNARRNQEPMALLMLDLDHFKEVNDTLGHLVGDKLLMRVGERFQSSLREPDTLGRLGGDEFAVVLPRASQKDALIVAEKLQDALRRPVDIDQNSFSVAASIGISMYPDHGPDPSSLLRSADIAMYVAKRARNDYAVYKPDYDTYNPDHLSLLRDLRESIRQGDIDVVFQPKLDLRSGIIIGVEALARWHHPERGDIPPYEFIPILEQTGLIRSFTLQILEKAVGYCTCCRQQGMEFNVAVNLSMHNLRDNKLPEQIREILDRYDFDCHQLILEITESAIMQDPEHSLEILDRLDKMGLKLSVDDFGTGYSSLSHLKRLPVSQLKIDCSFIKDMTRDEDDAMIVRSTIELAHNLGLETVAEGVEDEQTLEQLRALDCDMAQGFLISRPLSPDNFLRFMKSSPWAAHSANSIPSDIET
ncbi:diguanylate cyclase/phosphodiesterase (GGDEF & EAL domains) with PAS/PAC sensor(s) [hydrothermal vent metagenome]|uniref:Diguanylate cyclase/phosphodiesterase (GGDEF & EAL domains) with PAS/PAC sensor(S) n=1 Tax=hydrothermal vent metagenome TaxID=652676 RepID=A0A3B0YBZ3_9ZZZZ